MQAITTIGSDIAKSVFRYMAKQNLKEAGKVEGPEKCDKEKEHKESKYVQPIRTHEYPRNI